MVDKASVIGEIVTRDIEHPIEDNVVNRVDEDLDINTYLYIWGGIIDRIATNQIIRDEFRSFFNGKR